MESPRKALKRDPLEIVGEEDSPRAERNVPPAVGILVEVPRQTQHVLMCMAGDGVVPDGLDVPSRQIAPLPRAGISGFPDNPHPGLHDDVLMERIGREQLPALSEFRIDMPVDHMGIPALHRIVRRNGQKERGEVPARGGEQHDGGHRQNHEGPEGPAGTGPSRVGHGHGSLTAGVLAVGAQTAGRRRLGRAAAASAIRAQQHHANSLLHQTTFLENSITRSANAAPQPAERPRSAARTTRALGANGPPDA
ncbi:hypothetical protein SSPO_027780 [Streptomyces antimycoticus]|uniref:Uncharacterized protein n=1 Tax=Streptomyces antimycoticus TaxID=68175 RepID=A0A499UIH8_9ACTN|nr:hypothetical protein SSPO_027780 [Streptomyces antimycoticus]